ncbi:Hypothetical protein Minf_2179 [Methylacidiphilum infernorum V4]|uniref:Uncharacterized protein n=1 Tax=Methylacidiphilum infernorum (isolate V4) TaxID=481448 RepID=B3DZP8_METI4|nr:Hypothetical protein Minf_2179 [Methylacidiphilum infernorum V4]
MPCLYLSKKHAIFDKLFKYMDLNKTIPGTRKGKADIVGHFVPWDWSK